MLQKEKGDLPIEEKTESEWFLYVQMSNHSGHNLKDYLKRSGCQEKDAFIIFSQIMAAVQFLHSYLYFQITSQPQKTQHKKTKDKNSTFTNEDEVSGSLSKYIKAENIILDEQSGKAILIYFPLITAEKTFSQEKNDSNGLIELDSLQKKDVFQKQQTIQE